MSNEKPMISVVVPTYNRSRLLTRALETLAIQTLAKEKYEVLIIDNNSKDETPRIAHNFCAKQPNFHYLEEKQQGVAHARNCGWKAACGRYVAQTDDDCEFPKNWLETAKEIIDQFSPAVFGGGHLCLYAKAKPRWYRENYGEHMPFDRARILDAEGTSNLYGCNLFVKLPLFETVGGFDSRFGMSGDNVAYGEEPVFLRRLAAKFPDAMFYFDPALIVYNVIRPEQMTLEWLARSRFAEGRCALKIEQQNSVVNYSPTWFNYLIRTSRLLLRLLLDASFWSMCRDRNKYPYIQNYLYEHTFQYVTKLGYAYEALQQKRTAARFNRAATPARPLRRL